MYGVVNGCQMCHLDRTVELDNRIYERNIPSAPLQPNYSIRPVSTKYDILPIFDRRAPVNVPIKRFPVYNTQTTFNPGTAQAPWSGFADKINTESELRNQFFALQNCEQSEYIPSSNSDMYKVQVAQSSNTMPNEFHLLQKQEQFAPFNPNTCNLGRGLFMNHTRQQLKEL